jgi:hypothetical protein
MQPPVGTGIDTVGLAIVWVPNTEGDHDPGQAPVAFLREAEDKAEWRVGHSTGS